MKSFELVKSRLDARKKGTPMSLEEAQEIFNNTTIDIGLSTKNKKYYWFAIMSDCGGFNTPRGAVNDALEYLKNGGY